MPSYRSSFGVDERQCHSGGGVLEETKGNVISDHVQTASGYHCMVGTFLGQHLYWVHPGEEEHFCRPVKLSGSCPSHRIVSCYSVQ